MSVPSTHESRLLERCGRVLASAERSGGDGVRLAILEGAASRLGGWSLSDFRTRFGGTSADDELAPFVAALVQRLAATPIPPAMAIAALGRVVQPRQTQKTVGAFYTDFRLAQYVGRTAESIEPGALLLDPAAGSGILLAAAVMAASGGDRKRMNELVAKSVCAADLNADALRACRASLAALCTDLDALTEAAARLRQVDSLLCGAAAWENVAPDGFDLVVGNPPWEKVKVSRHEFLLAQGQDRHYGAAYEEPLDTLTLSDERDRIASYANEVGRLYPTAAQGELDLYKAFIACSVSLLSPEGALGLIVPAGLIRSQGTEPLRQHLLRDCGTVEATVIDNRARFFPIDTRFKFLVLRAEKSTAEHTIQLLHATADDEGVRITGYTRIEREELEAIRPDLTIPEVRSSVEWGIVRHMHSAGWRLDDGRSPFACTIVREVDMTRDRKRFVTAAGAGLLPLAEGRMVGQHRFGAKAYRSGTGRRAVWTLLPPGLSVVTPQFFYPADSLPPAVRDRVATPRVGFCDVTGQTNERSIVAALVPARVVCGNKVPTIVFNDDTDGHLAGLFIVIANSLPFDWMARRVLTTSVNYFLLRSLPLPRIEPHGDEANRLVELGERCARQDTVGKRLTSDQRWELADWRAEIDARVLTAWGLTRDDLRVMLRDFPLLDRGQPGLPGEKRSTVTGDLALAWAARVGGERDDAAELRVSMARDVGACAYIASEFALEEGPHDRMVTESLLEESVGRGAA